MRIPPTTFGTVSTSLVRFLSLLAHVPGLEKKTPIIGFTPRLLLPSEDFTLPARFNLGLVRIIRSCFLLCTHLFFFSSCHHFSLSNLRDLRLCDVD